jgi:NADH pyrophosphatase NudC (nudix superfamily)
MPVEPVPTPRDTREIEEAGWFTAEEIAELPANIGVTTFFNLLRENSLPSS